MLELSQQFVSAVFGLECVAYTLPALSVLNGPHSHAHFCFFSAFLSEPEGEAKWHGKDIWMEGETHCLWSFSFLTDFCMLCTYS